MKRFFLLMAVLLLSSSGFISIEASAQTNERKVYSCAFDGYVNMREDPSYSAKKVGKFNNGPEGAVLLEILGDWTKIDISGTIGYVPTKYIQETPTIAYTGDVSVDWIEGIWKQGGTSLLIYNNGTWERGYDFEQAHGKYILQNNEIKFIPTMNQDIVLDEVLPINREENRLGDYERGEYLTEEEKEEFEDDESYSWDYGTLTKEDFKAWGKRLLEKIESETSQSQELQNSQVESIVSQDTAPIEVVQDMASVDIAEEIENAKTPFFESEAFLWLKRALIAVLACLFVVWLAKLIKKTNQKSKEKRLAKTQKEAEIAQNTVKDISKNTGRTQSRKKFPWAAVLIPAILVVAALAALKIFSDREDASSYGLYAFEKTDSQNNTLYGYMDDNGRKRIKPRYLFAKNFEEGVGIVKDIDGKWKCINSDGEELFVSEHGEISGFDDELFAIKGDNGFWGFVDKDNSIVVPFVIKTEPQKGDGRYWLNGTCIIGGGESIIDMTGQTISKPLEYDTILGQFDDYVYLRDKYGRVCVMNNWRGRYAYATVLDWDYYDDIYYLRHNDGGVGFAGKLHFSRNNSSVDEIDDSRSPLEKSNFRVNRFSSEGLIADTTKYFVIEDFAKNYRNALYVYPRIGTIQGTTDYATNKVKFHDDRADNYYYKYSHDFNGKTMQCLEDEMGKRYFPPVIRYQSHPNSSGLASAIVFVHGDDYTGKCLVNVQTGHVLRLLKNGEFIVSLFDDDGMARIENRLGSVSGQSYSFEYLLDSNGIEHHDKEAEKAVSNAYYGEKRNLEERAHEMVEARRGAAKDKQEVEIPSFQTPQDVISYLSRHTFKSEDKTISVVVKYDGVYANFSAITSAPRVVRFSSDEASLMAHSPLNNADMHIDLVRQGDNYLLKVSSASYTIVENYYYAY